MARTISTRIELDGEAEFKSAIKNINSELGVLKSEMAVTDSEFQGQANSVEALTKRQEQLAKQYELQGQKVKQLTRMRDAASAALSKANEELEEAVRLYGENSQEAEDYAKRVENAQQAQARYAAQVNKAQAELNKLNRSLQNNETYLDEARKSADGTASSIDGFGKKVKTAQNNLDDAGGAGLTFGNILSANVAGDVIVGAIGKLANGVADVAVKLLECVKAGAAFSDEISTLSITTSLSTDTLQEFQYMEDLIDVSLDTLTGSMRKLINNMDAARDGSKTVIEAFDSLGVEIMDSNGQLRNAETVFYEAVDALAAMGNETDRDAAAMDIFGKSAQDLMPLIEAGSDALRGLAEDAHEVGYVLGEEQLSVLNAQQDSLDRLNKAWDTLSNTIAVKAAPAVTSITDLMAHLLETAASGDFSGETPDDMVQNLVTAIEELGPVSDENLNQFVALYDSLLQRLGVEFNWEQFNDLAVAIAAAREAASAANPELMQMGETYALTASEATKAGHAHETYASVVDAATSTISERISTLREEYTTAYEAAYTSISQQMGLFETMATTVTLSVDDMIGALESQVEYMATYAENLKTATEMGLDEGLIQALSDGSAESAGILQEIVNAGSEKIEALNEQFRKVEEGKADFADTVAQMKTDFGTTMDEIVRDYGNAVDELDMYDRAMESGKNTMQGLLDGIDSLSGQVEEKFREIGSGIPKVYDRVVEIQSPSRRMYRSGVYTMEGLINGIDSMKAELGDTFTEVINAGTATTLEALRSRADELVRAYTEAYDAAYDSVSSQMGLFESMSATATLSVDDTIAALESQAAYLADYSENYTKASEMGISSDLLSALSDGSAESAGLLAEIANSTVDQIAELNKQFQAVEGEKAHFADQIASLRSGFSSEMADLAADFAIAIEDMAMYDEAYASGFETMEGFEAGAYEAASGVVDAFAKTAAAAVAAFNAEMSGISGTSLMAESTDGGTSVAAMQQIAADMVNGVQTAMAGAGGSGTYNVTLVTEDGATLGNWLLPSLISAANANGTPIQNTTLGGG